MLQQLESNRGGMLKATQNSLNMQKQSPLITGKKASITPVNKVEKVGKNQGNATHVNFALPQGPQGEGGGLTLRLKDLHNGEGIYDQSLQEFYKTAGTMLSKTGRSNQRVNGNPLQQMIEATQIS